MTTHALSPLGYYCGATPDGAVWVEDEFARIVIDCPKCRAARVGIVDRDGNILIDLSVDPQSIPPTERTDQ